MDCPECGAHADREKRWLNSQEYTELLSCSECGWKIETMSTLASRDRDKRWIGEEVL